MDKSNREIIAIFGKDSDYTIHRNTKNTLPILKRWYKTITGDETITGDKNKGDKRIDIIKNIRSAIQRRQISVDPWENVSDITSSPFHSNAPSPFHSNAPSRSNSQHSRQFEIVSAGGGEFATNIPQPPPNRFVIGGVYPSSNVYGFVPAANIPQPLQNSLFGNFPQSPSGGGISSNASVASIASTSSFRRQTYQIATGTIQDINQHLIDRNMVETGPTDDSSVSLFLNFVLISDPNVHGKELEEDLNDAIENMYSTVEDLCDESVDNKDQQSTTDWLESWSEPRNFDELVAQAVAIFDADVASVQIIDERGLLSQNNLQEIPVVKSAKSTEAIKQIIKNRRKITYSCYGEKNDISLPKFLWKHATPEQITYYFSPEANEEGKLQIKQGLAQRMLTENSKFAALKFACANKVPILIPENVDRIKSINSIYYFSQEIFWILQDTPREEQTDANPKFMWRSKRYRLLNLLSRCPAAIQLFENIYHNLCSTVGNVKISSVGGNPIRAFCLVMNCYFNREMDDCDELTEEIILGLNECFTKGLYSEDEINYLRTTTEELCKKLSDTDGIGTEIFDFDNKDDLTRAETQLAKEVLEYSLESHCSENILFTGENDFILIRSKANTLIDEMSPRLMACYLDGKPIQNKAETLKLAKTIFTGINWFPQMIPSTPFPYTYESLNEDVKVTMTEEQFNEIVKLYCVLQALKSINAELTQLVSSIISNNSIDSNKNYKDLRQYTRELCETVSRNIGHLRRGFSEDVGMLASQSHKVLLSYSEMFGLGNNESTFYATRVNNRILQELPSKFPELGMTPATYALKGKYKGGIRKPHSMALVVPGDDKGVNAILFDSVKQSNIGFKSLLSDDMNKSCQSYTLNRLQFGGPIEDIGDDGDDNLSVNAIDAAFANANANETLELSGGSKKPRKTRKRKPRKTRKRGKRGMRKTRKGAIA